MNHARQDGMSLIELMIAVILLGVFAAIAVPSGKVFLQKSDESSDLNSMAFPATTARAKATAEQTVATLCPADGLTGKCLPGGAWTAPRVVVLDEKEAATPTIIRHIPKMSERATIWAPFDRIDFNSRGRVMMDDHVAYLVRCDERGMAKARLLEVRRIGNLKVLPVDSAHTAKLRTDGLLPDNTSASCGA